MDRCSAPHRQPGYAPLAHRVAATAALAAAPLLAWLLAVVTWDAVDALLSEINRAPSLALVNATLADVLAVLAGAAGFAVATHLSVATALLLTTPRRSRLRRAAARLTPRPWRRIVAIAATGALSAGLAMPAAAAPNTSDAGWLSEPVGIAASAGPGTTPAPDPANARGAAHGADIGHPAASFSAPIRQADPAPLTVGAPDAVAVGEEQPPADAHASYVVDVGDSLWSITADALSDMATNGADRPTAEDVAAAWPELYEQNRDTIGENPQLIHPGAELTIPQGWVR